MNRTLNRSYLSQYKKVFTEQLIQQTFEYRNLISGKDILNLTPLKQFNLFILKILFTRWQDEIKKLQSPYFDYKHPEVKKSLVSFMNLLSQHIQVGPIALKPLISEAVEKTCLLAVEPSGWIEDELKGQETLQEKYAAQLTKYLVFHKEEITAFLQANIGQDVKSIIRDAKTLFNKSIDVSLLEELTTGLSDVLIIEDTDLTVWQPTPRKPAEQEKVKQVVVEIEEEIEETIVEIETGLTSDIDLNGSYEEEQDRSSTVSFDVQNRTIEDLSHNEVSSELAKVDEETEASIEYETNEEDDEQHQEVDEILDEDDEIINEVQEQNEAIDEEKTSFIMQQTEKASSTIILNDEDEDDGLNSRFETIQKTLADSHHEKKVNNITEALSVHHRYMFIQELFDGDNEVFQEALRGIESCNSFDEAVEMLIQRYSKEYLWDMNGEEVKELLKVVFRRFR